MIQTIGLLVASLVIGVFSLGSAHQAAEEPGYSWNLVAMILFLLALVLAAIA